MKISYKILIGVVAVTLIVVINLFIFRAADYLAIKFTPPKKVEVAEPPSGPKPKQKCRDTIRLESAGGRNEIVGEWDWNYKRTLDSGVVVYVRRDCK